MPTRLEIRESEEKIEGVISEAKQKRREIRAAVRSKAKELNAMRPQPPGPWIERVLDGIRNGIEMPLGPFSP